MDPYAELRTPSLSNSDASSSSSSFPHSLEDRPLPPLPTRKPVLFSDFPALPHPILVSPPMPSAPLVKSKAWRNMHRNAVLALRQPQLLARLLRFITWDDLYALFASCSGIRSLWAFLDIKDVILSYYLSGYRTALQHRDLSTLQPVDVTLHDLHLLRSSFLALPTCTLTISRFKISSTLTAGPASPVSYVCARQSLSIPCPRPTQ